MHYFIEKSNWGSLGMHQEFQNVPEERRPVSCPSLNSEEMLRLWRSIGLA